MNNPISHLWKKCQAYFTEEVADTPISETISTAVENPSELLVHLGALRQHLLRAALALVITTSLAFALNSYILDFLSQPIGGLDQMVAIDVTEPLATVMRVSLLVGFAIALPYIVFEIFLFIAPALSGKSRMLGLLAIPASLLLFIGGAAFAYFVMLPVAVPFLMNIKDITTQVRPSSYISFVSRVIFFVGLTFEFPLIILVLASLGVVKAKTLLKGWRIAIVVIAIIAAVITPTIDPVNMAIVMGPMIVLYFLSVLLAYIPIKGRN